MLANCACRRAHAFDLVDIGHLDPCDLGGDQRVAVDVGIEGNLFGFRLDVGGISDTWADAELPRRNNSGAADNEAAVKNRLVVMVPPVASIKNLTLKPTIGPCSIMLAPLVSSPDPFLALTPKAR